MGDSQHPVVFDAFKRMEGRRGAEFWWCRTEKDLKKDTGGFFLES